MENKAENKFVVSFDKEVDFEGVKYKELDLSNLENLTTRQLADAQKVFSTTGFITPKPEAEVGFCVLIAQKVTGMPVEFFDALPAKYGCKIKDVVYTFFQ